MTGQAENTRRSCARVLVVDDDPIMRSLVISQLSSKNIDVQEAEDGIQAWDRLKSEPFDLVVVDLDMPKLDGFDFMRCARAHPKTRHIATIVITSHEDSGSMQKALEAGATSFLTKPINWSTFLPHVMNLLQLACAAKVAAGRLGQATELNKDRDELVANYNQDVDENLKLMQNDLASLIEALQSARPQNYGVILTDLAQRFRAIRQMAASFAGDYEQLRSNETQQEPPEPQQAQLRRA